MILMMRRFRCPDIFEKEDVGRKLTKLANGNLAPFE
jgi:hypothetical protein